MYEFGIAVNDLLSDNDTNDTPDNAVLIWLKFHQMQKEENL